MARRSAQEAGSSPGLALKRRTLLEAALGSAVFSGVTFGVLSTVLDFLPRSANAQPDPLPSWREGAAKRAIVSFVSGVSNPSGPRFVAPEARVASFDADGTLWCERPTAEALYLAQKLQALASKQPALRERPAHSALLSGNAESLAHLPALQLLQLLADTHTGMTEEELADEVQHFLAGARHPRFAVPFFQLAYLPQLELTSYLKNSGFSVWLCTRGEVAFARPLAWAAFGIPPERVIGSCCRSWLEQRGERLSLRRTSQLVSLDEEQERPGYLQQRIGRRPIFAVANGRSGGDIATLRYVRDGSLPSLALLLAHDDAQREYAYDAPEGASRQAATRLGFATISMKNDWGQIFTFQARPERGAFSGSAKG